jgi:hypothetical protein
MAEDQQTPQSRKDFEAQVIKKAWKDPAYRDELVKDPKACIEKEMQQFQEGAKLPDDIHIKVVEESSNTLYMVLPQNPADVADRELSDDELDDVAGGTITVIAVGGLTVVGVVNAVGAVNVAAAVEEVETVANVHHKVNVC